MSDDRLRQSGSPSELRLAHRHSSRHRIELLTSTTCGCFYCGKFFSPSDVQHWIGGAPQDQTALCPGCGIDAVIGDKSGYSVEPAFLKQMRDYWFGT
jgi:hypothetical protein